MRRFEFPPQLNFLTTERFWFSTLIFGLLAAVFIALVAHPVNLVTTDLGRHIKNGSILAETGQVVATNYYSYTHPHWPVVNHHWGSGFLFYLAWRLDGITGAHLLFITLYLITGGIFLYLASSRAGPGITGLLTLLALPLLAYRTEARPEIWSYLLTGVFYLVLLRFHRRPQKFLTSTVGLVCLEIIWVNAHVYFFLGPAIVTAFLLADLLTKRTRWRQLLIMLGLVTAAALINPFGWQGAIAPLTIFYNYGYKLAENQPVWFMAKRTHKAVFLVFKIMFTLLLASFVLVLVKRPRRVNIADACLAAGFSLMAWLAVRNLSLFALFSLPVISNNLAQLGLSARRWQLPQMKFTLVAFIITAVGSTVISPAKVSFAWRNIALSLETNNNAAAYFFTANQLQGPIFNNYDIGGYLIYHLFPQEKVFVDNRPEAYPANFFYDIYIPMQTDENNWQLQTKKYHFNAIFFSYHDITPWGQAFLQSRLNDSTWVPVYVDARSLILLKNNSLNSRLIKRFALPRRLFSFKQVSN